MKTFCPYGGKVSFPNEHQAKIVRNHLAMRGKKGMRPYLCPNCHKWHLTTRKR
jgi:hypothetical protein